MLLPYCDKFLQGKSVDESKHVNGEGQLVLAMLCSFVQAVGAHDVYGILLSATKKACNKFGR